MRRTLASPILATSSNSPAAIRGEVLSASISTARRGERGSMVAMASFLDGRAWKLFLIRRFGGRVASRVAGEAGGLVLFGLLGFGGGLFGLLVGLGLVALHAVESIVWRPSHRRSFLG